MHGNCDDSGKKVHGAVC